VTHGPEVREVHLGLLSIVLEHDTGLVYGVVTLGHDLSNAAAELGWHHDLVLCEDVVFENETEYITSRDSISYLHSWVRSVRPLFVLI
jgi:hypothetical protein